MPDKADHDTDTQTPTSRLADQLLSLRKGSPPAEALTVAKQCLLDWLGVTLAARREPLVAMLAAEYAPADEPNGCTLIGLGRRASRDHAVLINGAMGHALDFDDVIIMMGHPTAPVAPVALAVSEEIGATGAQTVAAFIAGVEAECRVARLMGASHYAAGWHGTATYGSFGAAAAAAHLLDLESGQLLHALGLAGTQAAGLKSVFGTMSKPLHAGKAAQNGLLAARLAARGFTSDTNILGSKQGFADTQSTSVNTAAAFAPRAMPYVVDALFKYHAACYLTHNTIEAANALRTKSAIAPGDVEAVTIQVQPMHMGVCNIESPRTGLECKFSLRMTCALAIAGEDTFDDALFSDATAARPDLIALQRRISVEPTAAGSASNVQLRLKTGRVLSESADVGIPVRDLAMQQEKLERKFRHLVRGALDERAAERVIGIVRLLELEPDLRALMKTCSEGLRA